MWADAHLLLTYQAQCKRLSMGCNIIMERSTSVVMHLQGATSTKHTF